MRPIWSSLIHFGPQDRSPRKLTRGPVRRLRKTSPRQSPPPICVCVCKAAACRWRRAGPPGAGGARQRAATPLRRSVALARVVRHPFGVTLGLDPDACWCGTSVPAMGQAWRANSKGARPRPRARRREARLAADLATRRHVNGYDMPPVEAALRGSGQVFLGPVSDPTLVLDLGAALALCFPWRPRPLALLLYGKTQPRAAVR